MGSIIKFARPRPRIPDAPAKISPQRESRETHRSLFVLTGSFFITATVMCAVVVATVSSTWTDVLVMSAFVLVFALLKIVLANALIYTMLRYDAETANAPVRTEASRGYGRFAIIRRGPRGKRQGTESVAITKVRIRAGISRPDTAKNRTL
jgi:hypothetical protein